MAWQAVLPYIPAIISAGSKLLGGRGSSKLDTDRGGAYYRDLYSPLASFLRSRIGQGMPAYRPTEGSVGQLAESNISRALRGEVGPRFEESFRTLYRDPALKSLEEDILPKTRRAFIGPGTYWGSERAEAEQKAISDVATEIGKSRERVAEEDISRALKYSPSILEEEYKKYLNTLPEYSPLIQYMLSLLGETPYLTQQPTPARESIIPDLASIIEEYLRQHPQPKPATPAPIG